MCHTHVAADICQPFSGTQNRLLSRCARCARRTTFDVPGQVKAAAVAQGAKRREFVTAALEDALLKRSDSRPRKRVKLLLLLFEFSFAENTCVVT
jgi:hypothetical protein